MSRVPSARALAPGLVLCALLVAAAAPAAPARGTNLLLDPDFETPLAGHPWMPAGWDTSAADVQSVFFGRDTFLVERGRYAVSIANVSTLVPLSHNWSQAVLVGREAWNKDAVLTVWTRSNGLQGRAFILLQAYRDTVTKMAKTWGIPRDEASERLHINKIDDPLLDLGWKRLYFSEGETGWVRRTVRVRVPPSVNVLYVRLGLAGTGQVLFDDASLTLERAQPAPAYPVGANLLADPGFEGSGNEWEYSIPPYEDLQVVRDTTVAHGGRASIRMEGGLGGIIQVRTGVGQAIPAASLAGKRIRVSGYIRTDSLQGVAYILIYAHGIGGAKVQNAPRQYSMTEDWQLASSEMDLPADTQEVWAWFVYNAPATGRVYYDDCRLEVLPRSEKQRR